MSLFASPESGDIYNDPLYWRDPLPSFEDNIGAPSVVKLNFINNANVGREEKSICKATENILHEKNENSLSEALGKSISASPLRCLVTKNEEGDAVAVSASRELQISPIDQYSNTDKSVKVILDQAKGEKVDDPQDLKRQGSHRDDGKNQFRVTPDDVHGGNCAEETLSEVAEKIIVNDVNSNTNNNNSRFCEGCSTENSSTFPDDTNYSDTGNTTLRSVKTPAPLTFTYTSSKSFNSAVILKRKLLPLGVMGNSSSHNQAKKAPKPAGRGSRHHYRSGVSGDALDEKSDSVPSSSPSPSAKTRKLQHNDNSSVGSRLSGHYDDISMLSSGGVISCESRQENNFGSVEEVKSPRLSAASSTLTCEASTSTSQSLHDLLVYKPCLKTEFDFRRVSDLATKNEGVDEMNSSVVEGRVVHDEESEDTTDSTLLTLRGVCCAITTLQEKLLESNDAAKSPDHLTHTRYTGKRHPSASPSYPILSTRTPMSPALSPYNSPGTTSPAEEPSTPLYSENIVNPPQVNSMSSTDPEIITVKSNNCDMDVATSSKGMDSSTMNLHDILSSTDGFSGSLLRTWLGASYSDVESERFVQEFCESLLRAGILVKKERADRRMSGKEGTPSSGRNNCNRLKFVHSQFYTWGPFSRLASNSNGDSSNKASTYKDYAVRRVEFTPTVAATENCAAAVKNGVKLDKSEDSLTAPPCTNDPQDSSCASSTTFSSGYPSQNVSGDLPTSAPVVIGSPTSIIGSPTSPSGSNTSKKLGNVWPPPQSEEDYAHKLKYTEAEHQNELMVLKRNHNEELGNIKKGCDNDINEIYKDHALGLEAVYQETNLIRQELAHLEDKLNTDKQDASTQTPNVSHLRMTKGIQVDLMNLPPPPQIILPTAEDVASSPAVLAAPPCPVPPPAPPCPVLPPPPPPPPPPCPPPPPPPPLIGGPPPPPPPPPCFAPPPPSPLTGAPPPPPSAGFLLTKKDSPKRRPIEPKKPMKPLYWKRIQIPKKELSDHKSVWAQIEDLPLNTEEMEFTFCKATTSKKSKALSDLMTVKKKIMPAKVLDNKRSQAVGIFLSSLHIEMTDLQQAILNLDTATVDEENMKAIYDLRANKKEVDDIKSLEQDQNGKKDDEKQPLDKPEKFLYSLSQIDHFEERMYCITFRTTFYEDVQDLEKELSHMNNALQELQDENTVLRVLCLILSIGNYLNGGNRTRGQADGFQLDILSKLKDVKGQRDGKNFSLLNYLAWLYLRKFDQDVKMEYRVCPVPSFQSIALASQVDFNNFSKGLKRMQRQLKECEKKVTTVVKKAKEHEQPFKDTMEDFLDTAYTNLVRQEEDFIVTQKRYKEVLDLYCIKAKSSSKLVEPKEFFALWQSFCMDFHAIWKTELKRFIKAEQQEAEIKAVMCRERQATTVHANQRIRANGLKSKLMRSGSRR